jgi:hypothetical protein
MMVPRTLMGSIPSTPKPPGIASILYHLVYLGHPLRRIVWGGLHFSMHYLAQGLDSYHPIWLRGVAIDLQTQEDTSRTSCVAWLLPPRLDPWFYLLQRLESPQVATHLPRASNSSPPCLLSPTLPLRFFSSELASISSSQLVPWLLEVVSLSFRRAPPISSILGLGSQILATAMAHLGPLSLHSLAHWHVSSILQFNT